MRIYLLFIYMLSRGFFQSSHCNVLTVIIFLCKFSLQNFGYVSIWAKALNILFKMKKDTLKAISDGLGFTSDSYTPCGSEITTFGFFNLLGNTDLFTSNNRISKDNHLNTKSTDQ